MKLFVDDIRRPYDDSWATARTVSEAIRLIAQYDFNEISLDHDIGHEVVVDMVWRAYPCLETFEAVAWFIREKYKTKKDISPKIILHTGNRPAAEKMQNILGDSGLLSIIQSYTV